MNSRDLFYVRYLQSGLITDKKFFFNILNIEKELFSFYPKLEESYIVKIKLRWFHDEVLNLNKRNHVLSDFENLDKISPQIIKLINVYDKIIDDINLNNGQNQITLFKNLNKENVHIGGDVIVYTPRVDEIDVELWAAPKGSYSLSDLFVNPDKPPPFLRVLILSFLPVIIL